MLKVWIKMIRDLMLLGKMEIYNWGKKEINFFP